MNVAGYRWLSLSLVPGAVLLLAGGSAGCRTIACDGDAAVVAARAVVGDALLRKHMLLPRSRSDPVASLRLAAELLRDVQDTSAKDLTGFLATYPELARSEDLAALQESGATLCVSCRTVAAGTYGAAAAYRALLSEGLRAQFVSGEPERAQRLYGAVEALEGCLGDNDLDDGALLAVPVLGIELQVPDPPRMRKAARIERLRHLRHGVRFAATEEDEPLLPKATPSGNKTTAKATVLSVQRRTAIETGFPVVECRTALLAQALLADYWFGQCDQAVALYDAALRFNTVCAHDDPEWMPVYAFCTTRVRELTARGAVVKTGRPRTLYRTKERALFTDWKDPGYGIAFAAVVESSLYEGLVVGDVSGALTRIEYASAFADGLSGSDARFSGWLVEKIRKELTCSEQ